MRKWPAVPAASADESSHVPLLAFDPDAAAASQSAGSEQVASTVPLSASVIAAGAAPVLILSTADAPIAVSIASSRAFRTVTENLTAMPYPRRRGLHQ